MYNIVGSICICIMSVNWIYLLLDPQIKIEMKRRKICFVSVDEIQPSAIKNTPVFRVDMYNIHAQHMQLLFLFPSSLRCLVQFAVVLERHRYSPILVLTNYDRCHLLVRKVLPTSVYYRLWDIYFILIISALFCGS